MAELQYEKRVIHCKEAGLSEEAARLSLIKAGNLAVGTEIGAIYEDQGRWAATVFVPKIASPPFPPDNDNEETDSLPKPKADKEESASEPSDESPDQEKDDSPSDSGGDDHSPSKPKGESSGGKESEILDLLHQLLDAVRGPMDPMGPGAGMPPQGPPMPPKPMGGPPPGGPPGMGGPPPGAGGPPGGPGAPHVQEVIHKRVLKPGESPPGVQPVGAPSLASLQSFTAVCQDKTASLSDAKRDLEARFASSGLITRQLRRLDDGSIAALLTRR